MTLKTLTWKAVASKLVPLVAATGLLVGLLASCTIGPSAPGGTTSATCAAPALLPSSIGTDLTLQAGCYEPKDNVVVSARLTLLPGVTILFPQHLHMDVGNGGVLAAGGTATNGILLTGANDQPGYWGGLNLLTGGAATLSHVEIRDGGDASYSSGAALWVEAGDALAMDHTTVDRSGSDGFDTDTGASIADLSLSANTYQDNAGYPVSISANAVGALDPASTYAGNGTKQIDLFGDDVTIDQTWPAMPLPYFVDGRGADVNVDAALTLAPGAVIAFDQGMAMEVGQSTGSGTLSAVGQSGNRVTFRAVSGNASEYWNHLAFYTTGNQLSYVDLQGAGSNSAAEILVYNNGSLSVDHAIIDNTSAGNTLEGICGDSGTTVTVDGATVTFTTDPVASPTSGCYP